jgi:hypothetical protein
MAKRKTPPTPPTILNLDKKPVAALLDSEPDDVFRARGVLLKKNVVVLTPAEQAKIDELLVKVVAVKRVTDERALLKEFALTVIDVAKAHMGDHAAKIILPNNIKKYVREDLALTFEANLPEHNDVYVHRRDGTLERLDAWDIQDARSPRNNKYLTW